MAKQKTKTTTKLNGANGNGVGPHAPIFPGTRFDENEFAMLRGILKLYDDIIIQTRYDVAGQVVDEYIVDPMDIAMRLSGLAISTGPLPENCLFYQLRDGAKRVGILVKPRVWIVNVSGEKQPWRVPLPAMVFVGAGDKYHLWALSGHNWPKPETELFRAPCSNVSDYGVCRGNVPFPAAAPDTIWQAWGLFIESEFNNHLDDGKSRKHQKAILKMWQELHQDGAEEYPKDDLVSAHRTLAGVIDGD